MASLLVMTMRWTITWVAGPDAGATCVLGPGEHLVGRAPQAQVRCDDRSLEPFHAWLVLTGSAAEGWQVHQLAGRAPLERIGTVVRLGCSTLCIEPAATEPGPPSPGSGSSGPGSSGSGSSGSGSSGSGSPGSGSSGSGSRPLVRTPRVVPELVNAPLGPRPDAAISHGGDVPVGDLQLAGLVSAGLGACVAVVMAVVAGHGVLSVLALSGLLVAAGTVGLHWRRARGRRAAAVARHDDAVARWRAACRAQRDVWAAYQRARCGTLPEALASLGGAPPGLWQRRLEHGDAMVVALGIGSVPWCPVVLGAPDHLGPHDRSPGLGGHTHQGAHVVDDGELVSGVPVSVDLSPGAVVVVRGPHAGGLVRSLLVQLACQTGPADWVLEVDTSDSAAADWAWTAALPHRRRPPTAGGARHTVVLTDRVGDLEVAGGALRHALGGSRPPAVLVVDGEGGPLPAAATTLVDTTVDGRARARLDLAADTAPVEARLAALGARAAATAAALLGRWSDPDDVRAVADDLPSIVHLVDVMALPVR